MTGDRLLATYDGRATAAQNWEESTGVASGDRGDDGLFGALRSSGADPLVSPHGASGGLRYLTHVGDSLAGRGCTTS